MSMFHYIGSNRELPLGERGRIKSSDDRSSGKSTKAIRFRSAILPEGSTPLEQIIDLSHIKEDEIEVYDSMEDAAGIYIEELGNWNAAIRKHFKSPFVYQISPNWGSFFLNSELEKQLPDEYRASVKCINELFKLMREYGVDHDEYELYSCWANEEDEMKNDELTKTIDLKSFTISDNFELKERQYILVKI